MFFQRQGMRCRQELKLLIPEGRDMSSISDRHLIGAHARTHTHAWFLICSGRNVPLFMHFPKQTDVEELCFDTHTGQAGKYPSRSVTMSTSGRVGRAGNYFRASVWLRSGALGPGASHTGRGFGRGACPRDGSVLFTFPVNYQLSLLNVYYCLLETTDTFYIIINSN